MSEPQTCNLTVSEPYICKLTVSEPHTCNLTASEPHICNLQSEPHICNLTVSEPIPSHTANSLEQPQPQFSLTKVAMPWAYCHYGRIVRVVGCLAVVVQWQSTGGSSHKCVLGSTLCDCQPFHFPLFSPRNI